MKKKDIIGLQRQNKTKINPHCGVKTDYWTHEVRHIKSFAPTNRVEVFICFINYVSLIVKPLFIIENFHYDTSKFFKI